MAEIHTFWSGKLGGLERLSLASLKRHHSDVFLHCYEDPGLVPAGIVVEDARKIVPERLFRLAEQQRKFAMFTDLFRYDVLAMRGGFWVDLDVICIRPFPEYGEQMAFTGSQAKPGEAETFVIYAPSGHDLVKAASRIAHDSVDFNQNIYGHLSECIGRQLGRRILSEAIIEDPVVYSPLYAADIRHAFATPNPLRHLKRLVTGIRSPYFLPAECRAVHFFNHSLQKAGLAGKISLGWRGAPFSLYRRMVNRYLPGN
jgi:hypothetical protein